MTTYQTPADTDLQARINAELRGVTVTVDRYDAQAATGGGVIHGIIFQQGARRGVVHRGIPFTDADIEDIRVAARRWAAQTDAAPLRQRWVDDADEADHMDLG